MKTINETIPFSFKKTECFPLVFFQLSLYKARAMTTILSKKWMCLHKKSIFIFQHAYANKFVYKQKKCNLTCMVHFNSY